MADEIESPLTVDQQLGSPGFTLELGWLWGVALGLSLLGLLGHRRRSRSGR